MELTRDERAICDEVSQLGSDTWKVSLAIKGLNTDPKMQSVILFNRLWSNHRGFLILWKEGLINEAGMVLRSGLETAICIAANAKLGDAFRDVLRLDGAFTLQRQIKRFLEEEDQQGATEAEEALRVMLSGVPEGAKPVPLSWKDLSNECGLPQLYSSHRMLSGISAHVTGLSVMQGVVSDAESQVLQDTFEAMTKRIYLLMMTGATLHGSAVHAEMLEHADLLKTANTLIERMNMVSSDWAT